MSRVTACNHRLQASGYNGNMVKLPLPIWLAKDPSGQPIRCCHPMNDSAPDSVVLTSVAIGIYVWAGSALVVLGKLQTCQLWADTDKRHNMH